MALGTTIRRLLILFGIFAGFISVWYAAEFTSKPEIQAVNLTDGSTHSNYNAFIKFDMNKMAKIADNGEPDDTIVMLNMLKFRDVVEEGHGIDGMSGEKAYREVLGQLFRELYPQYGGTVIWRGRGGITVLGSQEWDLIILVQYPSREKFVEMINSTAYTRISEVRAASITDSRLIEMTEL